jgi:Bacterial protein of unknown function (DUF885)
MPARLPPRLSAVGLACLLACGPSAPAASPAAAGPVPAASSHARFSAFTARFLRGYLERFPVGATALGEHSHDGAWPDTTVEGDAATVRFVDAARAELTSFRAADLDEGERADASILANALDAMRFDIEEKRDPETEPRFYANLICEGLDPLVTRDFAPLEVRMRSLEGRLRGIPALVAVAKKRLAHPARVNTETAIEQTKGLVGLCEHDLPELFAKTPVQQASLEAARQVALQALRDFATFLHDDLLPRSDGSFRAGPAAFAKTLRFQLDDPSIDPDGLERDARVLMSETQARMLATALELWPTLMTGPVPAPTTDAEKKKTTHAVLDKLAEDHLGDDTIVPEAKRVLADATEFVRAHDLVGLPPEPCAVIVMPEYKRGFSTAYCDASGPLEAKPLTYVAISPPPADWPAERRLSQYREYNRSMLADLLVHEGMPGHYLQLMHSNRFHSDVRAVFENGAFVEGWAVYSEWLMAKHGFGGPKVRMEQLKMLLRAATNAVLDHEIHAGSMEEKEALALMEGEAFQEEGEAVGKWRRARLSRGQLSTYFYGFRELMKLREKAEREPGFNERAYNDRLLAFGSPPIRVVREQMSKPQ